MRKTISLVGLLFMLLATVVAMTLPSHGATCEQVAVTRGSPPVAVDSVTYIIKRTSEAPAVLERSKIQDICPAEVANRIDDLRYRQYDFRQYRDQRIRPTDTTILVDTRTYRVRPLRR